MNNPEVDMYKTSPLTEKSVLEEIGNRVRAHRIALNLSRDVFAAQAGVSKNTLVRLETGLSVNLSHFIKVLFQFGLAESLINIFPDYNQSPMMLLRESQEFPKRKRASRQKKSSANTPWVWKEDE
jgi:transcriptional regulator with XRE-family HTH domain